jgi:hypothetical protein
MSEAGWSPGQASGTQRVLITGMSGAGRSSLLDELAACGHRTVDTDYGGYFHTVDGESLWREDRIRALLGSAPDEVPRVLFVQGTTQSGVAAVAFEVQAVLVAVSKWPEPERPA